MSTKVTTIATMLTVCSAGAYATAQGHDKGPLPGTHEVVVASGVTGGEVWGANYWPNVTLTGHDNKKYRFFDDLLKDKVVVIDFIYTTCPDACPLQTAKLAEVAEVLGEQMGDDVFFYSISIDPKADSVEVLAEYAKRYRAGKGWTFFTGDEEDIKLIRLKCGLMDLGGQQREDHSLDMLVGNQKTGRWMKQSAFENPYMLATVIGDWLHNYKQPRKNLLSYEKAPALQNMTKGESLFRTRCSACHVFGQGDGLTRQGPNLLGVTDRRERKWLERWLLEPDVMLAEKDPVAIQMFEAFNKVAMPNLRLSQLEISQLLDYMTKQSRVAELADRTASLTSAMQLKPIGSCCAKKSADSSNKQHEPSSESAKNSDPNAGATASIKSKTAMGTTAMVSIGMGLVGLLTVALRRRN